MEPSQSQAITPAPRLLVAVLDHNSSARTLNLRPAASRQLADTLAHMLSRPDAIQHIDPDHMASSHANWLIWHGASDLLVLTNAAEDRLHNSPLIRLAELFDLTFHLLTCPDPAAIQTQLADSPVPGPIPGPVPDLATSLPQWLTTLTHALPAARLHYHQPDVCSLGCTLPQADDSAADSQLTDQFAASLFWWDDQPLIPGRKFSFRLLTPDPAAPTRASISALKFRIIPGSNQHIAAHQLTHGQIGFGNLELDKPTPLLPFTTDRMAGSFLLTDLISGHIAGAGMIRFSLRRATNIKWQPLALDKQARAGLKDQKPCLIWLTGLSGSGKSTLANQLEQALFARGRHTYVLDGDNVRHGLCRDLGFTDADRVENLRRIAELARLMVDAGLIVISAFISPFRSERRMARSLLDTAEFIEVFVDTPLAICEQRDPKGLYQKARAGKIRNFTGIDSAYEPPEAPELHLAAGTTPIEQLTQQVLLELEQRGII